MREILFRGKRIDGLWVGGHGITVDESETRILSDLGDSYGLTWCRVYPETVGQFTGLIDKNGKKIFEGDIVRCVRTMCDGKEMVGHIIFRDCCFCVKEGKSINQPAMDLCDDFEVIGNIHDNPDLLNGGAEDEKPL